MLLTGLFWSPRVTCKDVAGRPSVSCGRARCLIFAPAPSPLPPRRYMHTVKCEKKNIREVRWVRRDTRLTIRVTVWGRGLGGAKSQRVGRLRCRTQPGLSRVPERTGKLAPLTPFHSIIVPVVEFFGRSSFLLCQKMARSFTTHLTSFVVHRVRSGPDSRESGPNPGTGLT